MDASGAAESDGNGQYNYPGNPSSADASSSPNSGWEGGGDSGTGAADESMGPQSWQTLSEDPIFATVSVGDTETLELVKLRVTTQIEGLRARTLVDHIYYNPHGSALEGTFKYPLPTEASVSYYAMFVGTEGTPPDVASPDFFGDDNDDLLDLSPEQLAAQNPENLVELSVGGSWGELRTARVVESVKGKQVYEEITQQVIDPSLVEEIAPNTFQARVFPIPAQGYNRVVIAYEQTLQRVGDTLEYSFPIPAGDVQEIDVTVSAPKPAVGAMTYKGTLEGGQALDGENGSLYTHTIEGNTDGGWLVFEVADNSTAEAEVITGTNPKLEQDYFLARLHPQVDGADDGAGAKQVVFLVDTSLSENPTRFGISVQLLESILTSSPGIQKFNVMTFDAGARWISKVWIANNEQGRSDALAELNSVLLEGATDFSAALRGLANAPMAAGDGNLDVFVLSDGVVSWGDRTIESMLQNYEAITPFHARFFAYRTGVGAENLELFAALTQKGATFNCQSADAVAACGKAHQAPSMILDAVTVKPEGAEGGQVDELLIAGRQATLFSGATLTIAGRVIKPGPVVIELSGIAGGTTKTLSIPVTLTPSGELAPRAWAEIAVTQLLQARDETLEPLAMALSQHYFIASRVASFLVLETDEEYDTYDLNLEVAELDGQEIAAVIDAALAIQKAALTTWDLLQQVFTDYTDYSKIMSIKGGELLEDIAALVPATALQLPTSTLEIPLLTLEDATSGYSAGLDNWATLPDAQQTNPQQIKLFTGEADKRFAAGSPGAAVRALSSIVEATHGSSKASRIAGYRMASWGLLPEAAQVFLQVLRKRPFEPQSYRDLANALGMQRPALSAMLFEAVLAGEWDAKFGLLKTVAEEEYALFIQRLTTEQPDHKLLDLLSQRQQDLKLEIPAADLRVTITWNTDNTDIDLWIVDPNGEKCFYENKTTATGLTLLDDLTQGYGPERATAKTSVAGDYKVQVHYYNNNGNTLSAETYVNATIVRNAGTAQAQVQQYNVALSNVNDVVTIDTITVK